MVTLRADPWDPAYGRGFEALEDVSATVVDPSIEAPWTAPLPGQEDRDLPLAFVDGTLRVELRIVVSEGPVRAPGVLASIAAGWCYGGGRGGFGDIVTERVAIAGRSLLPPALDLVIGDRPLRFEPRTVAGDDDMAVLAGVQTVMRDAESALAASLAIDPDLLVLVDGPLSFTTPTRAPIIGVVKRAVRRYLPDAQEALLPRLGPGTRTPLFAVGDPTAGSLRYSWYTRLTDPRVGQHDLAGIIRCEVSAAVDLERAVLLADLVSGALPRFAGRPDDPRTPQNLLPVAGVERRIRHRLGDRVLVRRALTTWIAEDARRQESA